MNKIIFLDIDGVMNSQKRLLQLHKAYKKGQCTREYFNQQKALPYKQTLSALKYIVDKTQAKIVLTSVWRKNEEKVALLNTLFKDYGFQIYDSTCCGVYLSTVEKLNFKKDNCHFKYEESKTNLEYTTDRGAEIAVWLNEHPNVQNFVILDDDVADIKGYYPKNQVKTKYYKDALNMKCAKKAVKILNKGVV